MDTTHTRASACALRLHIEPCRADDDLLAAVEHRLEMHLRPRDTVMRTARFEFTVRLEGIADALLAARVAGRLVGLFARPFLHEGRPVMLCASVGHISEGCTRAA